MWPGYFGMCRSNGQPAAVRRFFVLGRNLHYPVQTIISDLAATVRGGGYLYVETFGGQGQNYLELPKAGEIRDALKGYDFHFYKERSIGPRSQNSVVVTALGQKRR
jgi:hypothetical protein